jgi:hypothetical protein
MSDTRTYLKAFQRFLVKDFNFNYACVYRPKKSNINGMNALNRLEPILMNDNGFKSMFYVIESDRYKGSAHAHLFIESENVFPNDFKTRLINPKREILDLRPIQSIEAITRYVQKEMGQERFVRNHGLIVRKQLEDEALMKLIHREPSKYKKGVEANDINKQLISSFEHPNKKYHDKAIRFMNTFSFNRLVKFPLV